MSLNFNIVLKFKFKLEKDKTPSPFQPCRPGATLKALLCHLPPGLFRPGTDAGPQATGCSPVCPSWGVSLRDVVFPHPRPPALMGRQHPVPLDRVASRKQWRRSTWTEWLSPGPGSDGSQLGDHSPVLCTVDYEIPGVSHLLFVKCLQSAPGTGSSTE